MSALAGPNHPKRRLASSLCAVGLLLTGVLSLSALALPTQEAGAATDVVTNCSGDPSTSGSLPNEIASAGAGDTITFALSPSCSTIDLTSTIVISQDLTLTGPGQTSLAVDGGETTEPFDVSSGTVTISGLTIQHGSGNDGGAINNSGTLTVSNSALATNSASDGGAVYNSGTLTVTSSTLSGNSATTGGGAIDNQGTVTVEDSTLSANTAGQNGGGLESADATMTVDNSTVSGNSSSSDGGGIDIEDQSSEGTSTIDNSTVTGDGAPFGGGIQDDQGPLTIGATIVADSSSGNACSLEGVTSFTDQGYNVGDDTSCGFTSPSVSGSGTVDSHLGSLANNGGPTQTVALEPGSPAIGLVTDGILCPSTDQRDAARANPCDAGAYDTNGASFDPSISTVTVGGSLTAPTMTVTGSGFGNEADLGVPASSTFCSSLDTGSDYDNFSFSDLTDGWEAGQMGNCTGVSISSYTATQVTFTFGGGYGNDDNNFQYGSLSYGDSFQMNVLGSTYNGSIPPYSRRRPSPRSPSPGP